MHRQTFSTIANAVNSDLGEADFITNDEKPM